MRSQLNEQKDVQFKIMKFLQLEFIFLIIYRKTDKNPGLEKNLI